MMVFGVDPHRQTHTAVAVDGLGHKQGWAAPWPRPESGRSISAADGSAQLAARTIRAKSGCSGSRAIVEQNAAAVPATAIADPG